VPALRKNNLDEHDVFHQTLNKLVEADGSIDLFEYMLTKMVGRQLRAHFEGPSVEKIKYGRVQDLLPECALLLSALAHLGNETEAEARAAFIQGVRYLDVQNPDIQFISRNNWDLLKIDEVLATISKRHESLKRNILLACGKTVVADEQITDREMELLRAIADSFDCPIPNFVEALREENLAKEST